MLSCIFESLTDAKYAAIDKVSPVLMVHIV